MDGSSLNNLQHYIPLRLLMSELRARNVKPTKGAGPKPKDNENIQLNKSINKKVDHPNYVRSFVAILALLAVGFFGVRVSWQFPVVEFS
jgi:hypothetical protein